MNKTRHVLYAIFWLGSVFAMGYLLYLFVNVAIFNALLEAVVPELPYFEGSSTANQTTLPWQFVGTSIMSVALLVVSVVKFSQNMLALLKGHRA